MSGCTCSQQFSAPSRPNGELVVHYWHIECALGFVAAIISDTSRNVPAELIQRWLDRVDVDRAASGVAALQRALWAP